MCTTPAPFPISSSDHAFDVCDAVEYPVSSLFGGLPTSRPPTCSPQPASWHDRRWPLRWGTGVRGSSSIRSPVMRLLATELIAFTRFVFMDLVQPSAPIFDEDLLKLFLTSPGIF